MQTASTERKGLELKKHVAAVHSSNQLSLVQRKIANALLYNAYEHLLDKVEYEIHIGSLCKLIGYDSKDQKKIKQALVALISTVIEWNLVDRDKIDDEGVWNASAIIADASIAGPICTYSYSHKMKQFLYRPEFYARLNMRVLAKFKSTYGLALYENCIRYQDISQTARFELAMFRKLMGVSEDKYSIFRDFKRRVLDKAIAEVNAYSPILVKVKIEKRGREVIALQFLITRSQSDQPEISQTSRKNSGLAARLRNDYGLSLSQIEKNLAAYSEEYILEKIALIEASASYQQGKIVNLTSYLQKALEQDYQTPKTSKEIISKQQSKKTMADEIRAKRHAQLEHYRRYKNQEILRAYGLLNKKEKDIIERQFERYIQPTIYNTLYLKQGLDNPLVNDHFCRFVHLYQPNLMQHIISFEKFCKQEISA